MFADEEQVEAGLKAAVQELSKEGFDVTLKLVNHVGPQPAHAIADVALEVGGDPIVVGTRGHEAMVGLVLGSVRCDSFTSRRVLCWSSRRSSTQPRLSRPRPAKAGD